MEPSIEKLQVLKGGFEFLLRLGGWVVYPYLKDLCEGVSLQIPTKLNTTHLTAPLPKSVGESVVAAENAKDPL